MRSVTPLNHNWIFHAGFEPSDISNQIKGEVVTLPHTAVELPLNYFDETSYQCDFCYQNSVEWKPEFEGRAVSLIFDGAMADATVYCNGVEIINHRDGYSPFEVPLSEHLDRGKNLITVHINGSENPEIPPFGGQIDYLTFAGIYRDVWLKITDPISIERIKVETGDTLKAVKSANVHVSLRGDVTQGTACARLIGPEGQEIAKTEAPITGTKVRLSLSDLTNITLWDMENPTLYRMEVEIEVADSRDKLSVDFGFRTVSFDTGGFRLNGKLLKLRGLNRHQSYPYAGYAMGRSAQECDAEILKNELRCNIVRTSHYPQSPWFLDHCDRIGLLVFEEIPGWQHVGDTAWQAASIQNLRGMIERDWNHPSIVIWGVRVNESDDFHDFYSETNRLAHELDSTRPTGGVRFIANSELLEDVYTINDFVLGGEEMHGVNRERIALRSQSEVTGLKHPVPYLITEFNGHMHPTKRTDPEQRQVEHVTRYLQVLNAAYGDPSIAGSIGWCMADYNTHKDFGSGDRICHHGVTDMFRIPKFAASVYASQGAPDGGAILEPVTYWARGERNIGGVLPLIVLTNCDAVEFHYGEEQSKRFLPDFETYPHLPHPPVIIDHRSFSADELGRWGMRWMDAGFDGFVDDIKVKEVYLSAAPVPETLDVTPDRNTLHSGEKDAVRVVIRALDQGGRILPYLNSSVRIESNGPARVIGPNQLVLNGGVAGFWLESIGQKGRISLTISVDQFEPKSIDINVI